MSLLLLSKKLVKVNYIFNNITRNHEKKFFFSILKGIN